MHTGDDWKISSIASTRETEGCELSPLGPHGRAADAGGRAYRDSLPDDTNRVQKVSHKGGYIGA